MDRNFHQIPFKGAPLDSKGVASVQLIKEPEFRHGEFVDVWSIYPVTIVRARYGGSFEHGASWLAMPTTADELGNDFWRDWRGDPRAASAFFAEAAEQGWLIGYGCTPSEAYDDLLAKTCRMVDVKL